MLVSEVRGRVCRCACACRYLRVCVCMHLDTGTVLDWLCRAALRSILQDFLQQHQFTQDVCEPRTPGCCLFMERETVYPIHLAAAQGDQEPNVHSPLGKTEPTSQQ